MRRALAVVLIVFLILACSLCAQEFRATITGRITDAQSAVVPGAKVIAVEKATGARYETQSTADGQYTLPFLTPGLYVLTAEATGFKRYVREAVRASTNARLAIDIQLELGAVSQTLTVTEEQSLLEVATASTGQVINARQIDNMPLNGRTPLVLAQLAFGVIPTSDPRMYRPFDNNQPSNFSVGGAPSYNSELLLDGAPDAAANNRVAYNPPVDAVAEVKVESFQADAAYGHTGGGTVNVVLRGGTNAFHGAAYNFNQVSKLAATPFFTNRAGLKNPVTRYNQWGANAGGPVLVPKLFNGRNKLFFYFAYEGIKDSTPEPLTTTVPTDAMRRGDFSQLLKVGSNYQIYDPLTAVTEGSRIRRQPFANNLIPEARFNPIAKAYLQFYPLPNQPGRPDGQDNYLANSVRSNDFNTELGRLDFNLSDRHKFFYNFRHNERLENRNNRFNNLATGNYLKRYNWGAMLDDVYTFTPTTMLNTRVNWTRFTGVNVRPSNGFDFTTLGFPASLKAASQRLVLPSISLDRFNRLGDSGGDDSPQDSFQVFASVTRVRGKHSMKFGTDLRLYRVSAFNFGNSSGAYNFSTTGRAARWTTPPRHRWGRTLPLSCWACPPAAAST